MLRKVGIRASVRPLPLALYVRMRGEGKLTAFLGFYPTNAQPDMDNIFDFFFNGNRDYWGRSGDPGGAESSARSRSTRRSAREIYKNGIDQVNKMNYILPVADLPVVMLTRKDVQILETPHADQHPGRRFRLDEIGWGRNRAWP